MFESLTKRIQAFLIVLLVVLLSVVMGVVGFGTPTEGCNPTGAGYAATVFDSTITIGDFEAAYVAAGFSDVPPEQARRDRLRELMLRGLIERELLAHEAERLGFTVDPHAVVGDVAEERSFMLTGPIDGPPTFPSGRIQGPFYDREGRFSTERMRSFIQFYLRRSVDEFVEWQVRETLAQRMRETIFAGVSVSPREVWDAYVRETERASISYLRFDPAAYRDRVELTDEAITEWMAAHEEEVDAEYRRQRHRYTNLEEQLRIRHILVRVARDASDEDKDAARAEAAALLQRIQAGEDFATLAREHSDENASTGGDLGWRFRGGNVAPVETAALTHEEPGLHDEVVESQFGFHVVKLEGRRSGDVPEAEAKRELAEGLYRTARAGELAQEEARRALAYWREGHSVDELNERLRTDWREPAEAPEGQGEPADGEEQAAAETPQRENAPQVNTASFGRSDRAIPGGFNSMPLTQAAFEMDPEDPLPEEPLQLGTEGRFVWVVFRLDERTDATQEGFTDEVRTRISTRLLGQKQGEVLSAYIGRLYQRAEEEGAIRQNPDVLRYGDEQLEGEEGEDEEGSEASASL